MTDVKPIYRIYIVTPGNDDGIEMVELNYEPKPEDCGYRYTKNGMFHSVSGYVQGRDWFIDPVRAHDRAVAHRYERIMAAEKELIRLKQLPPIKKYDV